MGGPDWRAMLVGMTSTEYADWHRLYRTHHFQGTQPDMHFSGLTYAIPSLFFYGPDAHPSDLSLLVPRHEGEQAERPDEDKMLVQKAAGPAEGVRFGGDGGRDILSSADAVDIMVDDAALMMASAGVPGGVRYVPVGWQSCY